MAEIRRLEVRGDADIAVVRRSVRAALDETPGELASDAQLVATELVTNALLHGGGVTFVELRPILGGLRIVVGDRNRHTPLALLPSTDAMTGRGFGLVRRLATRWGVDSFSEGKSVWAEMTDEERPLPDLSVEDVLAGWNDPWEDEAPVRVRVRLGEVPTSLLVAAKRHVDNLVREFRLATGGNTSGTTAAIPDALAELIERVVHDFKGPRLEIKRQATAAAARGAKHTVLELHLSTDAAEAAERYLRALDDADAYSRANRLLTLETPPQHRVFRHWYIEEIVRQLRAVAAGAEPPDPVPFEDRLLAEVDAAESARRAADRAARMYSVAGALATATTAEDVAAAVLNEGVAALGASGGGVLLATTEDRLLVPGTVGYDEAVIERLRDESPDAELPAAYALRTGEAVWLETVEERNIRFPALAGIEPGTTAICAVPVTIGPQRLGALRFSFRDQRLFDTDEQRFVLALAAEAAQALHRTKLLEQEREARGRAEKERASVAKLAAVGEAMLRGGDLATILQLATDAATQISEAEFGVFLYNGVDERGEAYLLHASSGSPEAAFARAAAGRNPDIFAPAFRGERTIRVGDVSADLRFDRNTPFCDPAEGAPPVRSYLAVPVTLSTGEVAGGLFFGHRAPDRFTAAAERLVAGVAGQAAAAIENVRAAEDRQRAAAAVQRSLLPSALPSLDRLDLGAVYNAAEAVVGGDFYDVFPIGPSRWGLVIGDVRGRGAAAASTTAMARHTIRAAGRLGLSPAEGCALLNDTMHASDEPEEFLSVLYLHLDVAGPTCSVTYANAGHPPAALVRAGGVAFLDPTGPLAGISEVATFEQRRVHLEEGDVVVLYTDGITEARREGEQFGEHAFTDLLPTLRGQPAAVAARRLGDAAKDFSQASTDDAAVLVLVVGGPVASPGDAKAWVSDTTAYAPFP